VVRASGCVVTAGESSETNVEAEPSRRLFEVPPVEFRTGLPEVGEAAEAEEPDPRCATTELKTITSETPAVATPDRIVRILRIRAAFRAAARRLRSSGEFMGPSWPRALSCA